MCVGPPRVCMMVCFVYVRLLASEVRSAVVQVCRMDVINPPHNGPYHDGVTYRGNLRLGPDVSALDATWLAQLEGGGVLQ